MLNFRDVWDPLLRTTGGSIQLLVSPYRPYGQEVSEVGDVVSLFRLLDPVVGLAGNSFGLDVTKPRISILTRSCCIRLPSPPFL